MRSAFIGLCLFLGSTNAYSQLLQLDDLWIKEDLDRLASQGLIAQSAISWPISARALAVSLAKIDDAALTDTQRQSVLRLEDYLSQARKTVSNKLSLQLGTEDAIFHDPSYTIRARNGLSFESSFARNNIASDLNSDKAQDRYRYWGEFNASLVTDVEQDTLRYDGSVIGATLGNWLLSVGREDRFWGNGWRHSLILSDNARPVTNIAVRRDVAHAFSSPWLSWIGPWSFESFMGLLDDDRAIEDAKLFGMSVEFHPHQNLSIGLRRTAQWGGEGRPEDLSSFVDLLIGSDNCDELNESGSASCNDRSSEPGNQLAGFDVSFKRFFGLPLQTHLQLVGEDEAGFAPAKNTLTGGLRYYGQWQGLPLTLNLEAIETRVLSSSDAEFNIFYEHSIYRSGYRYEGRSIGSTLDNDSRALHLEAMLKTEGYGDFLLGLSRIDLNRDGRGERHSLVTNAVSINQLSADWRYKLTGASSSQHEIAVKLLFHDERVETRLGTLDPFSMRLGYSIAF